MACQHCGSPTHASLVPSASCIHWLKKQITTTAAAVSAPAESTGDELVRRFDCMALKLGAISKFVKSRRGKAMIVPEVDALIKLIDADTIRASNDFRKLNVGGAVDVTA